jgi:hypothetical protein
MSRISRISALFVVLASGAPAQWLVYSTPGLPRTSDGKPNLAAPVPKTADGKPDLTGVWLPDDGKHYRDLAMDMGPGGAPMQPWAKELSEKRDADNHKDDPLALCMPPGVPRVETHGGHMFKIVQTPREVVILYETSSNDVFREIFTDGRPLPEITQPSWKGYSIGKWEGDTLVVETAGFNDKPWLDTYKAHPQTDKLHVTERFRRLSVGKLEIGVTIDDPGAYTKPWTAKLPIHLMPDTEIMETVCENSEGAQHLVGK